MKWQEITSHKTSRMMSATKSKSKMDDFVPFCKYCDVAFAGITEDSSLFAHLFY